MRAPRRLHPGLQMRDLHLKPGELRLVGLVARLLRRRPGRASPRPSRPALPSSCASCSRASSRFGAARLEGAQRVVEIVEDHAGPTAATRPARSSRPRTSACSSASAEGDAAAGESARTSSSIAAAVESTWAIALASSTSQRVPAASRRRCAQQPGLHVVGVEEQQVALDQRDRRGPGTGRASGRRCSL